MKLPSSSSILLASLALSSSSSSLAAPAGSGDTSQASSSSSHQLAFRSRGPNGSTSHFNSRGLHSPGTPLKKRSDRVVVDRSSGAYRKLSLLFSFFFSLRY